MLVALYYNGAGSTLPTIPPFIKSVLSGIKAMQGRNEREFISTL
jgi:hypothetical protein